jgi:drug/metabolite transporter (DMT)-like permease
MRIPTIVGIALILLGAFLMFGGGSFTSQREVLSVGDLTISAEERHPVKPWVAGAALAAGVVLVLMTARRKA